MTNETSNEACQELPLDDVATQRMLEGLARLHPLVIVIDHSTRVVWMRDQLGLVPGGSESNSGRPICEALPSIPDAMAQMRFAEQVTRIKRHLATHESVTNVQLDLSLRAGRSERFEFSAFRIATQDGRPLMAMIVDPLGARERAERREETRSDMTSGILDASPDAILALDRYGFISWANAAVDPILGLDPRQIIGKPAALLMPNNPDLFRLISGIDAGDQPPGTALRLDRALAKLAKPGDPSDRAGEVAGEFELNVGESGEQRLHVALRRAKLGDGHRHTIAYIRNADLAARRENELRRKNTELENYVHSVSHDLRSPLVSLLGFSRLLRQDYAVSLDETGRHFIDRIEQAGTTMSSLIEDLLALSRIGADTECCTRVDPRAVLGQLQAELKLRLEEEDATLVIPENPPLVLCDRIRLYQLFSNLIGNALQHMGDTRDRRIEVAIEARASDHLITVTDHGVGIAPEHHESIFGVFRTLGRRSRSGSSGVGLAIVKKIAETHGGSAWVESEPGHGARFCVTLAKS